MTTTQANSAFWNELCGTTLAQGLGITDDSADSLARFDAWYFRLYPYLTRYIPFDALAGKDVLEVGLGYGSVAQRLAEAGALYRGLDIAAGPVEMVRHRLSLHGLPGETRRGDVLECPFGDESFDCVVAIGCFHHTGDLGRALDETWRVLRPGGTATVMVYNAYSYRRWLLWPRKTWQHWRWDVRGRGLPPAVEEAERRAYDASRDGTAASETVFVSVRQLARLCKRFSAFQTRTENAGGDAVMGLVPRHLALAAVGSWAGLDIYCNLVK